MAKKKKTEGRGFIKFAIVVLILLLVALIFKKDNLFTWIKSASTISRQKVEIQRLSSENEALEQKIKDLSTCKDSLEKFARENYSFSQKGDEVFIIE